MKSKKLTLSYAGGLIFLSTVIGVGYMQARNEANAAGVPSTGGAGERAPETLTLDIDNLVARAMLIDASRVRVDLFTQQGAPQFSTEFTTGSEQEETLRWTLHGSPATTGGLQLRADVLPSLRDAITLTLFVRKNVLNATSGQEYDNWGCDSLMGIGFVDSCGSKGRCCDYHDACYAANSCNASSWLFGVGSSACKQCNSQVVSCVRNDDPGPSECCSLNNCGKPR